MNKFISKTLTSISFAFAMCIPILMYLACMSIITIIILLLILTVLFFYLPLEDFIFFSLIGFPALFPAVLFLLIYFYETAKRAWLNHKIRKEMS